MTLRDAGTAAIFFGHNTKIARKTCPSTIWKIARRKLDALNAAAILEDLTIPPNNNLHALTGDRAGQHAIAINDQYRICFTWTNEGAVDVEIVDYH